MEVIGIAGFGLASVAYLVFSLLLLVIRQKSFIAKQIVFISVMVLATSIMSLVQIQLSLSLKYVLLLENVKLSLYLLLLVFLRHGVNSLSQAFRSKDVRLAIFYMAIASTACWSFSLVSEDGHHFLFLLFLVLNLGIMVYLEQIYRNADAKMKWALWPLVIALGTLSTFDFIIFAQATMLDQLDFSFWYARGFIIALGMPFILISARRIKNWEVEVFVSREVVFYSTMLMIAGVYLLVLASAGYLLRLIGGQWGDVLSIVFALLGLSVLATLLLTERLRREVKVFITKHFYANKYDYRIEWLKSIEQLAQSENKDFYANALDIICSSMHFKKGALIRAEKGNRFKVVHDNQLGILELPSEEMQILSEFCLTHSWIIDVKEYVYVEDVYKGLNLDLEFYRLYNIDVIVPVINADKLYGLFLLSRGEASSTYLNWEDRDLLFAVTKQLSNYLSLNEARIELSESKQFEAFHRMSAFLVHDLKNVQAQLSLISSNAEKHKNNPAFIEDVFETVESATERLEKVLNQLRNKQLPERHSKATTVESAIHKVVEQRNLNKPSVDAEIDGQLDVTISDELVSVLNHLVQNAQEATPADGWVSVKASLAESDVLVAVIDNGSGMNEAFIKNRLFKPFDTTKGNAGMGIGAYEAKQFVESLGGSISVTSIEGEGSIFTLRIPSKQ
ncbi:XrtA/PEP-CTERM system histidine kinase PrsK [Thalassotalea euphylliae]|uniref:XrtA/PEP-CTERM system histidine kinase PrsK n=1 Tax=Thalassotalea euphylliae TaxID=1655234 RepID=UPI00362D5BD7